ncbi:MAG: enoyl-CoA hydratase [Verrucomicrobiales bacterium]|jgi:enoyl-CoA hydratase
MGISTERVADGTVALIRMDDGKVNALSKAVIADLISAIDEAEQDPSVVGAVIAGREGKFSAGFDLNVMRSGDFGAMVDLVADGGDLVRHVYRSDLPVVAACTGHALAAGALLLLGCDLRVGARGPYKIGVNEVAIGMVLPDWAMTICRERLSKRHLQRAVATARITEAEAAIDVGFLDIAVDPDEVVSQAIEEAAGFAALDRAAYAKTMQQFRDEITRTMAAQIKADRGAVF